MSKGIILIFKASKFLPFREGNIYCVHHARNKQQYLNERVK